MNYLPRKKTGKTDSIAVRYLVYKLKMRLEAANNYYSMRRIVSCFIASVQKGAQTIP